VREDPPTRLERARKELVRVIRNLPEGIQVNIIAYSTRVRWWRKEKGEERPTLHPLTPENKDSACAFVDGFRSSGNTATDLALKEAYSIPGVRCFYLLSDGAPTRPNGSSLSIEEVLEVVDDYDNARHIVIHTLGFRGAHVAMMKRLAEKTAGKYSDIP
jgi:hypothetical protein